MISAPPTKSIEKWNPLKIMPISDSTSRIPENVNHQRRCSISCRCGTRYPR